MLKKQYAVYAIHIDKVRKCTLSNETVHYETFSIVNKSTEPSEGFGERDRQHLIQSVWLPERRMWFYLDTISVTT